MREFEGTPDNLERFLVSLKCVFNTIPDTTDPNQVATLLEFAMCRLCPDDIYLKIQHKVVKTFDDLRTVLEEAVYRSFDLGNIYQYLDSIQQQNFESVADFAVRIKLQKPILRLTLKNSNILIYGFS